MSIAINAALSAYRTAAQSGSTSSNASALLNSAGQSTNGLSSTPGASFTDLLKQGLSQAVNTGKTAETMEVKGLAGQADMRDVVMAVANAEQTLSTVVTVRDKVMSAYQEIMKMPI